ncbi:MAG: L,D-transpeptidase family protein [Flavobacteriales bacterium]|jgi:murein L,D-transpeptidase YcbB/YkuD|nr:L,D-transpeptidase family protein [Flavobacteriales bacterium]
MTLIRIVPIAIAVALLASCGEKQPEPRPSIAEKAVEINAVFETPKPYTTRRMDSTDVLAFLEVNPQYRGDSAEIRVFYAARGHQYAWFVNDSLSTGAEAMLNLLDPTGNGREAAPWRMLVAEARSDSVLSDSLRLHVELGLTAQFFLMAHKEYGGYVQGDLRELDWYIPRRKKNYTMLLDSLVAGRTDLSPIEPVHPQYQGLKYRLQRYYEAEAEGPLDTFAFHNARVAMGDTLPELCDLRHRLFQLGDLGVDSITYTMDSTLFNGIVNFQERHGLKGTGKLDADLAAALNVPIAERIRTILLNMERLRWVNPTPPKDHILVNIPEYRLHVFENGKDTLSMNVVVGAVATHTVIFSGELSQIAFAPYWNIPKSIIRNEVAPAMRRNANYLAKQRMELVRGSEIVPTSSVDWSTWQGDGPFRVRQRPGANNSLGLVKFLFPNEYSIYLHDTPAKSRFIPEKRAFSHGCIRLSEPKKLADYLLRNDSTWTPDAIEKAMHASKEKVINLRPPMPVTIGYFTAWVDTEGRLNFRDDVYGHDARLARELFAPETVATAELALKSDSIPTTVR